MTQKGNDKHRTPRELSEEASARLRKWGNVRSLEDILDGKEGTKACLELLELELSLEPISDFARWVREAMSRMEPAELDYMNRIDALVGAIGAGECVEGLSPVGGERVWENERLWAMTSDPDRRERLKTIGAVLECWVEGLGRAAARDKTGADDAIIDRAYGLLGEVDDEKVEAVEGITDRFVHGKCEDRWFEWESMDSPVTLAQKFAHQVTMMDWPLWHLEHDLSVFLAGVGQKRKIADWREPGGPLPWFHLPNLLDLPRMAAATEALRAWLDDRPAGPAAQRLVATLGDRNAYKEKEWLARCLLQYLLFHESDMQPFLNSMKTEWVALGPRGFTLEDLGGCLLTGDISWFWPRAEGRE